MPLSHGERAHAGFRWEDRIAEKLENKGAEVEQAGSRRHRYDLEVNGQEVDVKAAIKTKYEDPRGYPVEGYVFSNLKASPQLDYYILVCLDGERDKIEDTYIIPSDRVQQRTVTITKNTKYQQYKNAWDRLMSGPDKEACWTTKVANLAVYRDTNRGDGLGPAQGPRPRDERSGMKEGLREPSPRMKKKEQMYEWLGAAGGGLAGGAIGATVAAARNMLDSESEIQEDVDFGAIVGAAGGGIWGKKIGRNMAYY